MTTETFWKGIGFAGQGLFAARFAFQWLASERKRTVVIPAEFWVFSILGGLILLSYSIYVRDPVFIVGQVGGLVVYTRNVMLMAKNRRRINMRRRRVANASPPKQHAHAACNKHHEAVAGHETRAHHKERE